MKSKLLLIALLITSVQAAPPAVEQTQFPEAGDILRLWLRHNAAAAAGHRAFRIHEAIDKTPLQAEDVLLTESYSAEPIVYEGKTLTQKVEVGDYFTFKWDGKVSGQGKETLRIVGAITPDGLKTISGTVIPFANVTGIVRRILRVNDTTIIDIVPVSNVVIQ